MFNKLTVVYALCGCIASGHWFANEYNAGGDTLSSGNPATSALVGMLWPMYASFVFFDEEE